MNDEDKDENNRVLLSPLFTLVCRLFASSVPGGGLSQVPPQSQPSMFCTARHPLRGTALAAASFL